jgi:hypothetical protein
VPETLSQELKALPGWRMARSQGGGLPGCSLIVPTYERPSAVPALLTALAALPDPPEEVVIVDGSPHACTGSAASEWAGGRGVPFDLVYARDYDWWDAIKAAFPNDAKAPHDVPGLLDKLREMKASAASAGPSTAADLSKGDAAEMRKGVK